jgi:hypothetical protein
MILRSSVLLPALAMGLMPDNQRADTHSGVLETHGLAHAQTQHMDGDGSKLLRKQVHVTNPPSVKVMMLQEEIADIGRLNHNLALGQAPGATSTKSESFFDRMKASVGEFFMGIILFIFSIPVLWFNERRAAQMESVIAEGYQKCESIEADKVDPDKYGSLVHIVGRAHATEEVTDERFEGATFNEGCIILKTTSEMYQWVETKTVQDEERLGGGRDRTTRYSYNKEWCSTFNGSNHDQDYSNQAPPWELGTVDKVCAKVEYGSAFRLDQEKLLKQAHNAVPVEIFPKSISAKASNKTLQKDGEYYHTCQALSSPQIGDMRVKFTHVADGDFTVIALQDEETNGRAGFLPFRAISRGLFGFQDAKDEIKALVAEGKKSESQLAKEDPCANLGCLCCCFTIVASCFTSWATPQIFHLYDGYKEKEDGFDMIKSETKCFMWVGRLIGWLMMFLGLVMIFSPIVTFLNVIPFLGPYIAKGVGFVIGLLSFLVTMALASVIAAAAWLFYRPLAALLFVALVWGRCAAVSAMAK